jgi:hypothetical protein
LVAHRDYSSIASGGTDIPVIERDIFGIFHGISELFLFIPQFVTEPGVRNTGLKCKTVKVRCQYLIFLSIIKLCFVYLLEY